MLLPGSNESTRSQPFLLSSQQPGALGTVRPTQVAASVLSMFVSEPYLLLGTGGSGLPRVGFERTVPGSWEQMTKRKTTHVYSSSEKPLLFQIEVIHSLAPGTAIQRRFPMVKLPQLFFMQFEFREVPKVSTSFRGALVNCFFTVWPAPAFQKREDAEEGEIST